LLLLSGDIHVHPGPLNTRDIPELSKLLNNKGIKTFHQNVRGLFKNIDKLKALVCDFSNMDITLSETHINTDCFNNNTELYSIPGFTFIHKNRHKGTHGGVGMYISDKIKWRRRLDLESDVLEGLWIEIFQKNSKSFIIGTMCRPPHSSKYLPTDFATNFNKTLNTVVNESREVTLLGDLNINYLKKNDNKEIKEIIELQGFVQIVTKATRITETSETLIDVILTTNVSCIKAHDVIPTSIGDHDMVGYVRKINHTKFNPRTIRCRNYTRYNHYDMASEIKNLNWDELYHTNNVESVCYTLGCTKVYV